VPISINQINSGTALFIDGNIYLVTEFQHVKPGKGGAFAKVKLKNVKTQQVMERTLRSSDKVDEVHLEEKKLQHLYQSGEVIHFMDLANYEEIAVSKKLVDDEIKFLQDNLEVKGLFYKNKILKIDLPIFIEAEIMHTEPGFKGDSSKAGTKPGQIDTGTTIQIPLFIEIGDKVKIDTRTGQYVERVKR